MCNSGNTACCCRYPWACAIIVLAHALNDIDTRSAEVVLHIKNPALLAFISIFMPMFFAITHIATSLLNISIKLVY